MAKHMAQGPQDSTAARRKKAAAAKKYADTSAGMARASGQAAQQQPAGAQGAGRTTRQKGYAPGVTPPVSGLPQAANTPDAPTFNELPRRRTGKVVAIVACVLAALLVIMGVSGFVAYRDVKSVKADVDAVKSDLTLIKDAAKTGDGDALRSTAADMSYLTGRMNTTLDSPVWHVAEWLPVYGSDVRQARELVATLDDLSTQVVVPMADMLAGVKLGDLLSDATVNLPLLEELIDAYNSVKEPLAADLDTINAMPAFKLEKLESMMAQVRDQLDKADGAIDMADAILPALPGMLGANGETQTYLILAINNVEIKASGGLPGSWGTMTVTDGRMEIGDFVANNKVLSEDQTHPTISDEERTYIAADLDEVTGSATLTPDFERVGELAAAFWEAQTGQHVDGVVGVDVLFLQDLLKLTGGFTAEDGTEVNGDNAAKVIMSDTYWDKPVAEQDAFFASIAGQAFATIFGHLSNANMADLVQTMVASFEARNLQVYMENPTYQAAVEAMGAAGTLSTSETAPVLGVYLNDQTWSKIDWYLNVTNQIGTAEKNADGSTSYTVTTTLTNMLTPEEAATLPAYVAGYNTTKRSSDDMVTDVWLYAPAGGSISNIQLAGTGEAYLVGPMGLYGFETYYVRTNATQGQDVVITYTVTTATSATEALKVQMTPLARTF